MLGIHRHTNTMLVDADNYYCSVERIFNPKLRNRPVIVLSNNDGIVARSKESKAIGISMGIPRFQIDDLICRYDVAVLSSNYELYGELSRRFKNILAHYCPDVEDYSIDEAFLSFSINQRPSCRVIAKQIRERILAWVGLPVTIGIGANKTLSKVAVEFAKKHPQCEGVLDLSDHPNLDEFLVPLQLPDKVLKR